MTYPSNGASGAQPPTPAYPAGQQQPQQAYPPQAQQAQPQPAYPQQAQPQQGYPQQAYPQQGYPPAGQYGAPGGVYQARFTKHTGMLLMWQQRTVTVEGTFEQITAAYKEAQTHCLAAGWWSISSIVAFNWIALIGNLIRYNKVKKAAGR